MILYSELQTLEAFTGSGNGAAPKLIGMLLAPDLVDCLMSSVDLAAQVGVLSGLA